MQIDTKLIEFATDRQAEVARAVNAHGYRKAAKELGISASRARGVVTELRKAAGLRGYAPEVGVAATPPGFTVKRMTVHNKGGEVGQTWVQYKPEEKERFDAIVQAVQAASEGWAGKARPVKAPKVKDADLLAVYPFGDPHMGLFAWAAETGDSNFDLSIAERVMFGAVDHLVSLAPPAEQALLISAGDLFHADNLQNRTTRSGHVLDVDTRYPRVFQVAIETIIRCIDRCLVKHKRVKFISAVGNHDDCSAVTLAHCVAAWYRNEPRVEVDLGPGKFHWHRHGQCLIGVTHGDTVKTQKLPLLMAHDRAQDWGECRHRHWYVGHVHHHSAIESGGVTVETLRTLTSRDAYAAGHGYRSGQDMRMDLWHKDRGLINRHIVGVEQLAIDRD